jgi:hypothetical protein
MAPEVLERAAPPRVGDALVRGHARRLGAPPPPPPPPGAVRELELFHIFNMFCF